MLQCYITFLQRLQDYNVQDNSQRNTSGIVMETTGSRETAASSEQLKVSVYFLILDAMLSELNRRFADKNLEYMKAIQVCSPQSQSFLEPSTIKTLAESYALDVQPLSIECSRAKQTLAGNTWNVSVMFSLAIGLYLYDILYHK